MRYFNLYRFSDAFDRHFLRWRGYIDKSVALAAAKRYEDADGRIYIKTIELPSDECDDAITTELFEPNLISENSGDIYYK